MALEGSIMGPFNYPSHIPKREKMTDPQLPLIEQPLLETLNKLFPEKSPVVGESMEQLMFRGGQRSVVRFLEEAFKRQNENIINRQVL